MKIPFGLKIGAVILTLSVGATGISVFMLYNETRDIVVNQMRERLKDIGRTGSFFFGENERQIIKDLIQEVNALAKKTDKKIFENLPEGESVDSLSKADATRLMQSDKFQTLVQILRKIKVGTQRAVYPDKAFKQEYHFGPEPPSLKYVYLFMPIGYEENRFVKFLADADYAPKGTEELGVNIGALYNAGALKNVRKAFAGYAQAEPDFYRDKWSNSIEAGIPIRDRDDSIIAVMGLTIDADSEVNKLDDLFYVSISVVGITFVLAVVFSVFLARILSLPVRRLRLGAEAVKNRDFTTQIEMKTGDEFQLLAETFNEMVVEIRDYATNLETLNTAYYRFVPKQFLEQLGRESITKIQLGDQIQTEITILFTDIRSFTTLSESMTPDENFTFLNSYLQSVAPEILQNNGFIDKYIGDAIMALFVKSPEDAVKAAIGMLEKVHEFNSNRRSDGLPDIKIGLGIHTGVSMLGTIGSEERMEGTVISDSVNTASRLEGLTKKFGAEIIISRAVLDHLEGNYLYRSLGSVNVKGKKHGVQIYEVLNGLQADELQKKLNTKEYFEQGLEEFFAGRFDVAKSSFKKVLKVNENDRAAKVYYSRCLKGDTGEGGALVMNSK